MQNYSTETNENNPEHFPNTTTNDSTPEDTFEVDERSDIADNTQSQTTKRPFSFSSDYTAPRDLFSSAINSSNSDIYSTIKPNAIVYPIRRFHNNNESGRDFTIRGSNVAFAGSTGIPRSNFSHTLPANMGHFAEELNKKLSYLNYSNGNRDMEWSRPKNGSGQEAISIPIDQRPLFITTVPRGIFLPPPKEIVYVSPSTSSVREKRQLYAYSSQPMVYRSHEPVSHKYYNTNTTSAALKDKYNIEDSKTANTGKYFHPRHKNIREEAYYNATTGGSSIPKLKYQQFSQINEFESEKAPSSQGYKNVMHDKRVVRGSNFGTTTLLTDIDPFDRAAEQKRRQALLKRRNLCAKNQRNVLGTPPPVRGRMHEVVQTDKYLEELYTRPIECCVETQTDLFLEKPPSPPYVPSKVGVDVATEICEGELFQFETEAQSIIDILVDNTIELSILEVAHEEEINVLRCKQEKLLAQREAELAELRRLEAEEVRLAAEKERRLQQNALTKTLDDDMQKGVTAAKLLQGYISSIVPEILNTIDPAVDAAEKDKLMNSICPWLSEQVAEEVGQIVDSREILTVIIQEIIKERAKLYTGYSDEVEEKPCVCEEE